MQAHGENGKMGEVILVQKEWAQFGNCHGNIVCYNTYKVWQCTVWNDLFGGNAFQNTNLHDFSLFKPLNSKLIVCDSNASLSISKLLFLWLNDCMIFPRENRIPKKKNIDKIMNNLDVCDPRNSSTMSAMYVFCLQNPRPYTTNCIWTYCKEFFLLMLLLLIVVNDETILSKVLFGCKKRNRIWCVPIAHNAYMFSIYKRERKRGSLAIESQQQYSNSNSNKRNSMKQMARRTMCAAHHKIWDDEEKSKTRYVGLWDFH